MNITRKLITPNEAQELLKHNFSNRNVRNSLLRRYSSDILENRWRVGTGEFIKVSVTGRLLDGQHRLLAIVNTNKPVEMDIIYDIADEHFAVIDTGGSRSGADVFKISGVANYSHISSIISNFFRFSFMFNNNQNVEKNYVEDPRNYAKPSNNKLLEKYNENPFYWDNVVNLSQKYYKSSARLVDLSAIGGLYSVIDSKFNDSDKIIEFFDALLMLEGNVPDYIRLGNKKLRSNQISHKKISTNVINGYIIDLWNAFYQNKERKQINMSLNTLPKLCDI